MKRLSIAAAICMLSACGGNSGSGSIADPGSAAKAKTFSYGSPVSDPSKASALSASLMGVVSGGSVTSSSAQTAGDLSATTNALLGTYSTPIGVALPQLESALAAARGEGRTAYLTGVGSTTGSFDDPACVQQGTGSVAFNNCKLTVTSANSNVTVNVNGTFTATATSAKWKLNLDATGSGSSGTQSATIAVHYGSTGDLTATTAGTVTTVDGTLGQELAADWTVNGNSDSFDVSEAVVLTGVKYDKTAGCVIGGTLEAKRVWVKRPSGASAVSLPDKGAKVTWLGPGCGNANIAISTN